jgi:hypothetical protein
MVLNEADPGPDFEIHFREFLGESRSAPTTEPNSPPGMDASFTEVYSARRIPCEMSSLQL